jgi:ribonuclease HII
VIMAASIIAKVARDREMVTLSLQYPQYGFEKHKGYGTEEHVKAIKRWGITPLHRRHFDPIRMMLLSHSD